MVEKICHLNSKKRVFNNTINTLFSGDEIPMERIHYVCISAICIDSVLRRAKKIIVRFI